MRTNNMSTPLFTLTGLFSAHPDVSVESLRDHAVEDRWGRRFVSMIDVLSIARPDTAADLLLIDSDDGAILALTIGEIIRSDDAGVIVERDAPGAGWTARLGSTSMSGLSAPVVSMCAESFAVFVGCR